MAQFLVTYRHRGHQCSFPFPADSWEDAEDRLKSLAFARVIGSNVQSIPVNSFTMPFAGALARLIVWWRNRNIPR